jgi:hypothetical protein
MLLESNKSRGFGVSANHNSGRTELVVKMPTCVLVAHRRITFAGPGTGECRKPAPLKSRVGLEDGTSASRGEWTSQLYRFDESFSETGITEQFGVRFGCLPRTSCMFADHRRERTGSALFHDPSNDPDLHPSNFGNKGFVGADIRHVFKEITFGTKSRPEPETTTSDGMRGARMQRHGGLRF